MLSGSCVLVVEDDPLIAMVICDNVDSVGGTVAGPFSTVGEALTFLTQAKIDAAIVDANLRDRDVTPLALFLMETAIPFIVYSAAGLPPELHAQHPDLPLVMKPGKPLERLFALLRNGATDAL
jgi:CheY-like chemotaxis protein